MSKTWKDRKNSYIDDENYYSKDYENQINDHNLKRRSRHERRRMKEYNVYSGEADNDSSDTDHQKNK